ELLLGKITRQRGWVEIVEVCRELHRFDAARGVGIAQVDALVARPTRRHGIAVTDGQGPNEIRAFEGRSRDDIPAARLADQMVWPRAQFFQEAYEVGHRS